MSAVTPLHFFPDPEAFRKLAGQGNLVPVWTELTADFETPVSAYLKLRDGKAGVLLESADMTSATGRYSFLGFNPLRMFVAQGKEIVISGPGGESRHARGKDVMAELEAHMAKYRPAPTPGLPVFHGGAVGYLSYDAVRQFEPTVGDPPPDSLGLPEAVFFVMEDVVIFDHRFRKILLVANAMLEDFGSPDEAYEDARRRIRELFERLNQPLASETAPLRPLSTEEPEVRSNTTRKEYEGMVRQAKEYIKAGDIFQVVPSQRFEVPFAGPATDLYRALRYINPSPYMFCMEFPQGFSLVGSSPEVNVTLQDGVIRIRPIAGTRWRGKTPEEDDALAAELLADPKERAEHIMLVDLARNDVGRVAAFGEVSVTELMTIERYSHVMHIVSNVTGRLALGRSAYDVMRSTFPAGTVSGSPKVRAMQIIDELEKNKRCAYAGAVGYFSFEGNLDSCIALRTCVLKEGKAYIQAGAGVVADSDPSSEYVETVNKAKAMMRAVQYAGGMSAGKAGPKED
jgi:anthranilate synthase component 1